MNGGIGADPSKENADRTGQSDTEVVPEKTEEKKTELTTDGKEKDTEQIKPAVSLQKPSCTQRFCKCAVLKWTAVIVALLLYVNIGHALGKWHMKVYRHPELFSVGTFLAFPFGWYNEKFICGTPNKSDWFKGFPCHADPFWEAFSTNPLIRFSTGKEREEFPPPSIRQTAYQASYIFFWPALLAITVIEITSLVIFSFAGILLIGLSLFWIYFIWFFSVVTPFI